MHETNNLLIFTNPGGGIAVKAGGKKCNRWSHKCLLHNNYRLNLLAFPKINLVSLIVNL